MLDFKLLYLFPFILFLFSCSSNNSTFIVLTPSIINESIVYIYRPASLSNALISPVLKINKKDSIEISNNSYTYVQLAAGRHIFKLNPGKRYIDKTEIELDVEPQKIYFLKISTSLKFEKNRPYTRRFDIKQRDQDFALAEIGNIPYTGKNKSEVAKESTAPKKTSEDSQFSIDKTRNPFSR